jgi:hypothetical protein
MRAPRWLLQCLPALGLMLLTPRSGPAQVALEFSISADLVRAGAQRIDESIPLHVWARGFRLYGESRLVGRSELALVPCSDLGVIRLTVNGCAFGGAAGPRHLIYVDTFAQGSVQVLQDIILDGRSFAAGSPAISVRARTELLGAETDFGPLANLAARSAARVGAVVTQRHNDRLAERIGGQLLAEQLSREVGKVVAQSNEQYQKTVLEQLRSFDLTVSDLSSSTTADALYLRASVPGLEVKPPSIAAPPSDARLSMHQTLMNRALLKDLGGRMLTGDDLEKRAQRMADQFKFDLPPKKDEADMSITLDAKAPMTVSFERGQAVIVIRGTEYAVGDTAYPAMNVTSRWNVVADSKGVRFVRLPELEVYPPDFVPGSGKKLPFRLQAFRTVLSRRFGRLMPVELDLNNLAFAEAFPGMPGGRFRRATAADGWLVLDWQRDRY